MGPMKKRKPKTHQRTDGSNLTRRSKRAFIYNGPDKSPSHPTSSPSSYLDMSGAPEVDEQIPDHGILQICYELRQLSGIKARRLMVANRGVRGRHSGILTHRKLPFVFSVRPMSSVWRQWPFTATKTACVRTATRYVELIYHSYPRRTMHSRSVLASRPWPRTWLLTTSFGSRRKTMWI